MPPLRGFFAALLPPFGALRLSAVPLIAQHRSTLFVNFQREAGLAWLRVACCSMVNSKFSRPVCFVRQKSNGTFLRTVV